MEATIKVWGIWMQTYCSLALSFFPKKKEPPKRKLFSDGGDCKGIRVRV